jgi:site-specific recombinase XerD
MSEFYNESIKNKYLDEIENEGSRHVVKYVFMASKRTEEILDMDLYNFSEENVGLVMENINPKTYNTARTNLGYIKNYISWSIKRGYRENNINPLDAVDRKWYSKYVDKTTKIHFSEEELEDFLEDFDNAQDQAMVQLWFEGVQGRDFSELKNLNYYDIDWNDNVIEVKDYDGTKRTLKVTDRCMRYLENAYKQTVYRYYQDGDVGKEQILHQSNFIFRNIAHRRTKEEGVSTNVIYSRLTGIRNKFNLSLFTPNAIKQSGQIHMAAEIFIRDGCFGDNGTYAQWEEIGDRYKATLMTSNGSTYYNTRLMKDYINTENLKELYDLDVQISIRERKK